MGVMSCEMFDHLQQQYRNIFGRHRQVHHVTNYTTLHSTTRLFLSDNLGYGYKLSSLLRHLEQHRPTPCLSVVLLQESQHQNLRQASPLPKPSVVLSRSA